MQIKRYLTFLSDTVEALDQTDSPSEFKIFLNSIYSSWLWTQNSISKRLNKLNIQTVIIVDNILGKAFDKIL